MLAAALLERSYSLDESSRATAVMTGVPWVVESPCQHRVRRKLERAVRGERSGRIPLHLHEIVLDFYEDRAFEPAWVRNGVVSTRAHALVDALGSLSDHGLDPEHYVPYQLDEVLNALQRHHGTPEDAVEAELALTESLALATSHLLAGRVDPLAIHPEWTATSRPAELLEAMVAMATARDSAIAESLAALAPRHEQYTALQQALARYRDLERSGGWSPLGEGPALGRGAKGERVRRLRRRLEVEGDLDDSRSNLFDAELEVAVRRFQHRMGLSSHGTVDRRTREEFDVPAAVRVRQLELTLERWRWLPEDLGVRHVLINIAGYWVRVFDHGEEVFEMRAIVGKRNRQTPVFSDAIRHVVLNPRWSVPVTIARRDILPKAIANPEFVSLHGFEVFDRTGTRIDASSVDWTAVDRKRFPYYLRQRSGPENALGSMKFMFPNEHDVYLHDTPNRELFESTERAASSGCIRLERPLDLAQFLLGDPWDHEALEDALANPAMRTLDLPVPVAVHLQYWTVWVDDGTVHFRHDIYGHDRHLAAALAMRPST